MLKIIVFFLLVIFGCFTNVRIYAQNKKTVIENGGFIHLTDGSILIGEILKTTSPYQIKILTGDTISVDAQFTSKLYLPDEIALYKKSKFHYKKGYLGSMENGFSNNHRNFDFGFSYLFNQYEIGIGVGFHNNSFYFSTANSNHFGDVFSIPLYAKGAYFLSNNYFKPYVFGKIGYSNNFKTFDVNSVNDGVMLEGGIGISFTSKTRSKFYMELSQYTVKASGTMRNNDPNGLGDIGFDLWFNRFIFTTGFRFGK
jgi:hypothetical protein